MDTLKDAGLTLDKHGKLVADGQNPDATRRFISLLRAAAKRCDEQAQATTAYKSKRLQQNARQARVDADRIERSLR